MPNQAKSQIMFHKVQLFWKGFKNLRNLSHGFDIYKIVHIFVAFSEKVNFKQSPNARLYFKVFESFGHKPLSKSEHGFDIYKIVQIFVAFSEKLNFKQSPNAGLSFKDFESFGHKPLSKSESIYFVFTDR